MTKMLVRQTTCRLVGHKWKLLSYDACMRAGINPGMVHGGRRCKVCKEISFVNLSSGEHITIKFNDEVPHECR